LHWFHLNLTAIQFHMSTAFTAEQIFTGQQMLGQYAVLVEQGRVVALVPQSKIPANYRRRKLDGLLAPAFIDLQLYGGNGKLFSTELTVEALDATYESCLAGGCTQFMITMATNSMDKFVSGMEVVKKYWTGGGKGLLGLHLEGPYINPVKKGAHLAAFIKQPKVEEVQMLLKKGKGVIKMITLAPEQADAQIIDLLLKHQIVVSAGHSNASFAQACAGFSWGIRAATHLFNAMSPL
jgi:N-acetylglucosamine-6-phosphate deacetylase